ncbi:hypothetical protein AVEN_208049-1 [Araneus ventricosus]|uniref:Amino acid permease N-terminal domain-containing protein n=1 Tax=Araneus ventricosus TaxID=182803 RepID=A0A4Y2F2V0_ARAVE|nr:hypothetical protein AVEN_208049-1 [Araneus ventricosus]
MEKPGSRFHVEPVQGEEPPGQPQVSICVLDSNDQTVASNYDSHNIRSLLHYTQEALPRLDHYRNVHSLHAHFPRPTLDELHNGNIPSAAEQEGSNGSLDLFHSRAPVRGGEKSTPTRNGFLPRDGDQSSRGGQTEDGFLKGPESALDWFILHDRASSGRCRMNWRNTFKGNSVVGGGKGGPTLQLCSCCGQRKLGGK